MSATVFVIGHRGMLGRVVSRYLTEQGHQVLTTDDRFSGGADDRLVGAIAGSEATVVVNCAGAVPARVTAVDEMLRANGTLPQQVALALREGQLLVQASSDGVFDGTRGGYSRTDPPDSTDTYGLSKRLGELARFAAPTIVLRTSIVGTGGGLLRWLLDQTGEVNGYTNHTWNGITTLEWARVCAELIARKSRGSAQIEQVTSEAPVTKFELLQTAATVYGLSVRVRPVESPRAVYRDLIPTITRPPIRTQLEELRSWEGGGA